MWRRVAAPDLILPPAQAGVFRAALGSLSDFIGWEEGGVDWESGWPVFDRLTQGQRQAALLTIGRALLVLDYPPPRVTAVLSAAVSTTYDALLGLIETEMGMGPSDSKLRRQVLAAVADTGYWGGLANAQTATSEESGVAGETWSELIEVLRNAILEDADHESGGGTAGLGAGLPGPSSAGSPSTATTS